VAEENFRPATGTIEVFEPPLGPGIRLDSGVTRGSAVSHHFDPMLAKLIVWAPSRRAAIDRMKRALNDFAVLGVRNNIEFLHRTISAGDFTEGKLDTGFLERHPELFLVPDNLPVEALLVASAVGVATGTSSGNRQGSSPAFTDVWNSGAWRNS
jgi:acetyl/propionyl-CoA carboxylase alpha subunit